MWDREFDREELYYSSLREARKKLVKKLGKKHVKKLNKKNAWNLPSVY
ncbi:hypothetical protein [Streptococcus suis]|nr:hypothetical protein [Streptococcus suis]